MTKILAPLFVLSLATGPATAQSEGGTIIGGPPIAVDEEPDVGLPINRHDLTGPIEGAQIGVPVDASPEDPATVSPCGVEPYLTRIGQSRAVIEEALGPIPGRTFSPDRMVGTTDHIPQRLNTTFDGDDILVSAGCG